MMCLTGGLFDGSWLYLLVRRLEKLQSHVVVVTNRAHSRDEKKDNAWRRPKVV